MSGSAGDDIVQYDDCGDYIKIGKHSWKKLQKKMKERGLSLIPAGGSGPVTKYRHILESRPGPDGEP